LRLFELVRSADIQDCDAGSWSGQPGGLEDAAKLVRHWQGIGKALAREWEISIESSTAWTCIAGIRVMTRRRATYCHYS
jgi:hypothetical protein